MRESPQDRPGDECPALPDRWCVRRLLSWLGERYSPGQLADLDCLDDLLCRHIDYRDVVGYAVGHQQIFLVRGECHVPDPLADQKIFRHRMGGGIDNRNAVGGAKRNETGLAVLGDADADRLDCLAPQTGNAEVDLAGNGAFDGVDDRYGSADLRRYPYFGVVALELGKAWPRIDQHVGDDLARRGVDEMRHVGGLGGIDQDLAVRAEGHAFRFDADLDVPHADAILEVDDGDRVVVLVGDIEEFAGGILREQFRIGAGGQAVHHLLGRGIDQLDLVVVADRDQHELAIPREFDTARTLADLDGVGDGPFVGVDHRYGVALLIRYIRDEGRGGRRGREPHSHSGKQTPTPHPLSPNLQQRLLQFSLHLVSGRSTPSVSSSEC